MSLAIVYTRAKLGIEALLVTVEVHLSNGFAGLSIVGMPETAVKKSKDRVRNAILNRHLEFPARRITVNLAPADLPKEGSRFDLAIALGILAASVQLPPSALEDYEFIGELALSVDLRDVDASEAALSRNTKVFSADNLLQVCAHLHQREFLFQQTPDIPPLQITDKDIADVKGQYQAKRALEVAAAGGRNLFML